MERRRDVLVVDDDLNVVDVLADLLMAEGYRVRTAIDGREALDVLSSWRPQVVLLDLMMPDIDGTDILAIMQADPELAQIPVVVISASDVHLGRRLSAAAVVAKPFTIDHLLGLLATLAG